jgi:hypothetical protein
MPLRFPGLHGQGISANDAFWRAPFGALLDHGPGQAGDLRLRRWRAASGLLEERHDGLLPLGFGERPGILALVIEKSWVGAGLDQQRTIPA